MTPSLEFEGKNVEKALIKASNKLNLPKEKIKYDILSYGSSGIFGLVGTKNARIRVSLVAASPSSKSVTDENRIDADSKIKITEEANEDTTAAVEDVFEQDQSGDPRLFTFSEDPLELGCSVLQRIVDAITSDAKIEVEEETDRVLFNVAGGNAAILIGKRGQTLEAIQSLVEKVVNKHNNNDNRIRVQVDIEGYLETRRENLEQLSRRLAEKTMRVGKPISMGKMNAHDRRIVHLALKADPNVMTKSRGEGYIKKLVIFPKRKNKKNG